MKAAETGSNFWACTLGAIDRIFLFSLNPCFFMPSYETVRPVFIIMISILVFFIFLATIITLQRVWQLGQIRVPDVESQKKPTRKLILHQGRVVPASEPAPPDALLDLYARRPPTWWSNHSTKGTVSSCGRSCIGCSGILSEKKRFPAMDSDRNSLGDGPFIPYTTAPLRNSSNVSYLHPSNLTFLSPPSPATLKFESTQNFHISQLFTQPPMSDTICY